MSMLDRLGLCKLFISYDEALACKSSRFSLGCSLPLVPKWAEYNVRSFSAQSTYMYMNRLSQLQFTKFVSHWNTVVAADFCAKFNKLQSCSSKMLYLLEKKCEIVLKLFCSHWHCSLLSPRQCAPQRLQLAVFIERTVYTVVPLNFDDTWGVSDRSATIQGSVRFSCLSANKPLIIARTDPWAAIKVAFNAFNWNMPF